MGRTSFSPGDAKRVRMSILLTLAMTLAPAAACAQAPAGGGAQAINSTVFRSDHIKAVTAVTEVFGRSQRTTAAIIEYDTSIDSRTIEAATWSVANRTITRAYANDRAEKSAKGNDGRFVVLELDPEDEGSVTFAPGIDTPATVVVSQVRPLRLASGARHEPTRLAVINTRQVNLIVDDFQQFRFTDPETGLLLTYNLYVPKHYDPARSYPLVLFMHDAGVTGTNPLRTLQQGLGAVSFASPDDQARHPAFVLAPQYPVALANDASQISDYADVTVRLLHDLGTRYRIDDNRIYATGQSGGCMTSIALNIKYPDLFAASLLVAGQWDPSQVAALARHKTWIIVAQDDAKAWPGMNAIVDVLEGNGARVTRTTWNGRASAAEFAADVTAALEQGHESNVFYTAFQKGTVVPEDATATGGAGHFWTWPVAYAIPGVRDWLLEQRK